jgi:hypothetical protein
MKVSMASVVVRWARPRFASVAGTVFVADLTACACCVPPSTRCSSCDDASRKACVRLVSCDRVFLPFFLPFFVSFLLLIIHIKSFFKKRRENDFK